MFKKYKSFFNNNSFYQNFKRILLFLGISLSLLIHINVYAGDNVYGDADLEDINLQTYHFFGYPLKVNISEYYDSNSNRMKEEVPTYNYLKNFDFIKFKTDDNIIFSLPIERIYFSKSIGGDKDIDSNMILDMPLYLKKDINYGNVINVTLFPIKEKKTDGNNNFMIATGNYYEEGAQTLWLIYNTSGVVNENQFLPRKVLVKIFSSSNKLLKTQIIDVFKEGKLSVTIPKDENIGDITKTNFYVVGNTNEKEYWYANGPVIKSIICPNKITNLTNCSVKIYTYDSGIVKIKIRKKNQEGEYYQIFSFNVEATGNLVEKSFDIDPTLGYPDGEYIIEGTTYKNGILQQKKEKEFIIDRFKPSFDEVYPVIPVGESVSGEVILSIRVTERLKAQPEGLKCDTLVSEIKRDSSDPTLYHIKMTLPSNKRIKRIKCTLKDIGLNTNSQYFYLKRYKDNGHLGISNINTKTNGLTMDVNIYGDYFTLNSLNSIGDGSITICNGDCDNNVNAIETYDNQDDIFLQGKKSILINGGMSGKKIYKIFPKTDIYINNFNKKIINITKDYLGNFWYTDNEGNYYRNGTKIGRESNVIYYNVYTGSYMIKYKKEDGLYIDDIKIENNGDLSKLGELIGFDILYNKSVDEIYAGGIVKENGIYYFQYYLINLMKKEVKLIKEVQIKESVSTSTGPDYVDLTLYNNKVIIIGGEDNFNKSYISILPLPKIIIVSKSEETGEERNTEYIASPDMVFTKDLYKQLNFVAEIRGYMLPKIEDCSKDGNVTIGEQNYKFDDNEWCNLKELNLDKVPKEKLKFSTPKFYYNQKLDNYEFNRDVILKVAKFGLENEVGEKKILLKNQPVDYWIGFVRESDILTKKDSPGWSYIKYDDKTFLTLPEIIFYTKGSDLKNDGFFVYKNNIKLQTLKGKTGYFYPVVVYKTSFGVTSAIRILGITTKRDKIVDKTTGKYINVRRILNKKPYKIDTLPPIMFNIKSNNTNPNIGDKITITFQTTEDFFLKEFKIGEVNVLDNYSVSKTKINNIYNFKIENIEVTSEMFNDKGHLMLNVGGVDKANNYNGRKINLEGLRGNLSLNSLQVGNIVNSGEIDIKESLITNKEEYLTNPKIKVLSDKKIITDLEINVDLPKKEDGSIDLRKIFKTSKILYVNDLIGNVIKENNYFSTEDGGKVCKISKENNNKKSLGEAYFIEGDCSFIRKRVYYFDKDIIIGKDNVLTYKGYNTIFVNGDVYIDSDIVDRKGSKKSVLGIIATGDIYVSSNVKTLHALIKTQGNIYILK